MAGKQYDEEFTWGDAIGGGLLSGYTAIVRVPEFGIDEEYRDDTVRFIANLEVTDNPDPDSDIELGHEFNEGWNVGNTNSWEASPDGADVTRIDGKGNRLNENSGYGKLVNAIAGKHYGDAGKTVLSNAENVVEVLTERLKSDGLGPFEAAVWDGLEFVWERLEFSFTDDDGEKVTYERMYPVEFVGVADENESSGSGAADANGEVDWDQVRDKVTEMVDDADSYSAWLASVMQKFPDIADSPLAADVMDSKSGLYAEANE